jgi:hypothetical protein
LLCLDLDIPDRYLVRAAGDAVPFRAMKVPPVSSPGAGAQGVLVGAGDGTSPPLGVGRGEGGGEMFRLCFGGPVAPKPKKRLSKQGFS